MTAPPQGQRPVRTPAQLADAAELGDEARALLTPELAHRQFFAKLVEAGQLADGVRFLAHCLPRREGVWWAWFTAKRTSGAEPAPKLKAALEATERWIAQPTEDNRRAAMAHAEAAGFDSPAGCAGLAAFLAGPTMAPPNIEQAVPPPEFACAKAIAGTILITAVATEPEKAPEKLQAALQQGLEVVNKIRLWPE
jgi:hypothetical protein